MKDDEYTGILELREKISNEKINKLHTKYDKPFSDRRYQVYYQVCLSKAKLPFFSYNLFYPKNKNRLQAKFCRFRVIWNFWQKNKITRNFTEKELLVCVKYIYQN